MTNEIPITAPQSDAVDLVTVPREIASRLLVSAKMLLQQMEGCIVDHHALDLSEQGWPGWIEDCRTAIEKAAAQLSARTDTAAAGVGEEDRAWAFVITTLVKFKQDIADGFFTRDRQYAIDMLNKAIEVRDAGRAAPKVRPIWCEGCGRDWADPPSTLCPVCQAYKGHQS